MEKGRGVCEHCWHPTLAGGGCVQCAAFLPKQEDETSPFSLLVDDVLLLILDALTDPEDLYRCRETSKHLCRLASTPHLWCKFLAKVRAPVCRWISAFPPPQWSTLPLYTLFAQLTLRKREPNKETSQALGRYFCREENQWFFLWIVSFVVKLPLLNRERSVNYADQARGKRLKRLVYSTPSKLFYFERKQRNKRSRRMYARLLVTTCPTYFEPRVNVLFYLSPSFEPCVPSSKRSKENFIVYVQQKINQLLIK